MENNCQLLFSENHVTKKLKMQSQRKLCDHLISFIHKKFSINPSFSQIEAICRLAIVLFPSLSVNPSNIGGIVSVSIYFDRNNCLMNFILFKDLLYNRAERCGILYSKIQYFKKQRKRTDAFDQHRGGLELTEETDEDARQILNSITRVEGAELNTIAEDVVESVTMEVSTDNTPLRDKASVHIQRVESAVSECTENIEEEEYETIHDQQTFNVSTIEIPLESKLVSQTNTPNQSSHQMLKKSANMVFNEHEKGTLLFFSTCRLPRDEEILKSKLEESLEFRLKLIKSNSSEFLELFPFFYYKPELVSKKVPHPVEKSKFLCFK